MLIKQAPVECFRYAFMTMSRNIKLPRHDVPYRRSMPTSPRVYRLSGEEPEWGSM